MRLSYDYRADLAKTPSNLARVAPVV